MMVKTSVAGDCNHRFGPGHGVAGSAFYQWDPSNWSEAQENSCLTREFDSDQSIAQFKCLYCKSIKSLAKSMVMKLVRESSPL